jgi:PAS domain S-box-containing protein
MAKDKEDEQSIFGSDTFTNNLIKSMQDGLSVVDTKGYQLYVNPAFCQMTGFSVHELVATKAPFPYWPPEEYENIAAAFQETLAGNFKNFEMIFMRKNGERFPVIVSPSCVIDDQGKILNYTATVKDVTDLKRTEEALKASEKRFRSLVENLSTAVVVHGPQTEILFANQAALNILGLSSDQIRGKSAMDPRWKFIDEDGKPLALKDYPVSQIISTKAPIKNLVVGVFRPDLGENKWAICNGHPELDKDGHLLHAVVNFTDITERKKLEEKLFETNAFLQAAIDQTHVGISIGVAPSGSIKLINQAGCSIMNIPTDTQPDKINLSNPGFTRYSLEGDVIPFEEIPMAVALLQGKKSIKELILKWPGAQDKVVLVNATPIFGKDGSVIAAITVFLDITDKFNLERDLKEALETAKNATIVKSRFLDIAAHELRTPVSAFSLLIQLAQKKIDQGIEVDPNTFVRLRKQVDRISQLVIDLLDVSRLERGAMKLKLERKDIGSLVIDCVEDIKLRSPQRNFKVIIPGGVPIECNIDVVRIYQVISNLLDNAIKYTPEDTLIETTVQIKQAVVQVCVSDHGPGISQQQQDEMFQPFTRGSTELTDPSGGLGLGLFICKSIIMLHGGSMEVSSEIGDGSTFTFNLPL